MKASFTGKRTTDGSPINDGDTIILWHERERTKTLAKSVRNVEWSDEYAAYMAVCSKHGYVIKTYLAEAMNDPNCRKVSKK